MSRALSAMILSLELSVRIDKDSPKSAAKLSTVVIGEAVVIRLTRSEKVEREGDHRFQFRPS